MSGVKSNISSAAQPAGAAGRPAANAGQSEPSIDDILASIRQIISDQNRQADDAAQKAAAEVANKAPVAARVESIIGTVAADHWNDPSGASASSVSPAQPQGFVPPRVVDTFSSNNNPSELEELIQLIGDTPPAPRPPKQAMWVDPQSKMGSKSSVRRSTSVSSDAPDKLERMPTQAASAHLLSTEAASQQIISGPEAAKPAVILSSDAVDLEQNPESNNVRSTAVEQAAVSEPRLHPSVMPKSVLPQVIKDAIARPLEKTVSAVSQPVIPQAPQAQKPVVSHKSALDKLIARKTGVSADATPGGEIPVQQIVAPKAVAAASAQPQKLQQAAPTTAPMQSVPIRASNIPVSSSGEPVQKIASNSPAISSQSVNAAVVSSIERLATSMFKDRKDEIDGMMTDIVRPMLKNWLEDNLPSLVERIVREEIERVSRGTHQ